MKMFKNAIRKILLTNIVRNFYKGYLVGNLGKVVEEEDKLICYVDKNKIKEENYDRLTKRNTIELIVVVVLALLYVYTPIKIFIF